MNSKDYWFFRELEQSFNRQAIQIKHDLGKEYSRCQKEIQLQLTAMYDEIKAASEDGTLLVSDLYRYNRYYEMVNVINKQARQLGRKEIQILDNNLTKMYEYSSSAAGKSIGFSPIFNQQAARSAVNGIWCSDGKHWSDRIWSQKGLLQQRIQDGMIDIVSRGASKDDLVKMLMRDLNSSWYCADRIARTELSYIQNKACLDKYQEAGIEKYRILGNGNEQEANDPCAELDGQEFYLKDAQVGFNYPPLHPNCECAVIAVI